MRTISTILAAGALCLFLVSCVTPRTTSPAAHNPVVENRILQFGAAEKEVDWARHMIEDGDYSVVIPRLLHVISKYPNSGAARDARYFLGVAYYHINSYRESLDLLNEYLESNGSEARYGKEAKEMLARVGQEYRSRFDTPEELNAKISEVADRLGKQPDDVALQLEMADLLWRRGDYESAGKLYFAIVQRSPEHAQDTTLTSRIELDQAGGYTVLTPAEVQRRQIAEKPLVIVNTASFRTGPDLLTRQKQYYAVTGQAYNRGDSVLYGVQVYITLYGHGNIVYDSTTVYIGRLAPGERRAFSVRFSNFDVIENIKRYECIGSFER